jgi:hypothetical protein
MPPKTSREAVRNLLGLVALIESADQHLFTAVSNWERCSKYAGDWPPSTLALRRSAVMPRDIWPSRVYEAAYAFARPGKLGRAAFSVDARSSLRNPIQKNKKTMAEAIAGTIQMERQS